MSDIFHLLALILPMMCGSLKSLCFLSPGGDVFLCEVSALSLQASGQGMCPSPSPGWWGPGWDLSLPPEQLSWALEQAVPVSSS